jgi:tetratricopeptide (TPR) repeat protein
VQGTKLLVVLGVLAAAPAAADIDNAKADKLFEQALKLRASDPAKACAKFTEALTYNPQAIATHLNVARCDEEQGRIASAAAKYREIIDRAANQKQDDYKAEAQSRLDALTEDVPHMTLWFHTGAPEGAKVLVDDKMIAISGRTRIEVDPGERRIVVTAPGRVGWVSTIVIAKRDDKGVELPELAKAQVGSSRRLVGKVTMITGGALFAASVGVALVARGRYNDAKKRCPADDDGVLVCTDADDLSKLDSAQTLGNVGTVIGIVGLAGAIAGGVLWWTAPTEKQRTGVARIDMFGSSHTAGLALHGRF